MQNTTVPLPGSPEEMAVILEATKQYRVLRRFDAETLFRPVTEMTENVGIAVVLDTETTGRDNAVDRIVELGMVTFAYNRLTGEVLGALERFNELEDPGMPISPDATRVNGITDEMVKGLRINDEAVQLTIEMADFIIAHNAMFDREICERRFPFMKAKAWACSLTQVDWEAAGISSGKLEFIAYRMGFYYEAHRADSDCLALLNALNQPLVEFDGRTPLAQVLDNFQKENRRVWAVSAPFDAKDELKNRGYRWSDGSRPGTEKAWWMDVTLEDFAAEMAWLRATVYGNRSFSAPVDRIDAYSRFSSRREKMERAYY